MSGINYAGYGLIALGLILILDQLNLFGIPFGGFLPDLSFLDPTQAYTDFYHHWMLGLLCMAFGIYFATRDYDENN